MSLSPEGSPKPVAPPQKAPGPPQSSPAPKSNLAPAKPGTPGNMPTNTVNKVIPKPIAELSTAPNSGAPPSDRQLMPAQPLRKPEGVPVAQRPIASVSGPELSLVKKEMEILQNEIARIIKDRELATQFQQDQINFMKTQLSNSDNERRKLLDELWKRDEQHKAHSEKLSMKIEDLQRQLQDKERELQNLEKSKSKSPIRSLQSYPSSDSADEELCSQDSFKALCRTQQQKKSNNKQIQVLPEQDEDYSLICQKKVELISDLLQRSNAEIISFFNVFTVGSSIQDELQNQLRQYEKEKSCHRAQLVQKEEERQALARENKSLLEKVDELINSRNLARRRAAIIEKKYEEKISATRELLKELKKHIKVQRDEINSLKTNKVSDSSNTSSGESQSVSQNSSQNTSSNSFKESSWSSTGKLPGNSPNAVVIPDDEVQQEHDPMIEEDVQQSSEQTQTMDDMQVAASQEVTIEDSQSVIIDNSPAPIDHEHIEGNAYEAEEHETQVQGNDDSKLESSQSVEYDYNQFYGDSQEVSHDTSDEVPLMSIEQYADYTRAQNYEEEISVTQEMDTLLGNKE